MKTSKEINIDGRTYTVFECQDCGATTRVLGRQTSKKAQTALNRPCRACSPVSFVRPLSGWWHVFGLTKNPYVYGPMPYKRTGERYRLEEARQMGWVAFMWQDKYTHERKYCSSTMPEPITNIDDPVEICFKSGRARLRLKEGITHESILD